MGSPIWILIVMSQFTAGSTTTFQEFNNKAACEQGAAAVIAMATQGGDHTLAKCVSKSGGF